MFRLYKQQRSSQRETVVLDPDNLSGACKQGVKCRKLNSQESICASKTGNLTTETQKGIIKGRYLYLMTYSNFNNDIVSVNVCRYVVFLKKVILKPFQECITSTKKTFIYIFNPVTVLLGETYFILCLHPSCLCRHVDLVI